MIIVDSNLISNQKCVSNQITGDSNFLQNIYSRNTVQLKKILEKIHPPLFKFETFAGNYKKRLTVYT